MADIMEAFMSLDLTNILPFAMKTGVALLIMFIMFRILRPYIDNFLKWIKEKKKLEGDEDEYRKWKAGYDGYCERKNKEEAKK